MSWTRGRWLLSICAALAAVTAAAVVRNHRVRPAALDVLKPLAPGSAFRASQTSAAPRAASADPNAKVSVGRPTMFHLDPARTNRSPFLGPADPVVSWSFDAGAPIETAPAILPDGTIVFGTLGGKLFGVTPQGEKAFSVDLHDRVYGSPLVLGDTIYVGADDKRLHALSLKGGSRWELDVDGEADTGPAPAPFGIVLSAGRTVVAVRANASAVWRVKAKRKMYSSPAVASDGTVWVGSQDNRFYGIAPDGHVRVAVDLGADVDCAPAVDDDGTVFVGVDGGSVVAIDPSTGAIRWRTKLEGHVRGGVTITRSHEVIAGTYGPTPRVVALRGATGEIQWSFGVRGTGATEFGVHGSPVEDAKGNLYFGAQDDLVYAIGPDGTLRWKLATGGDVDAPIVIGATGVLYAASDDGTLYCVRDRAMEPLAP